MFALKYPSLLRFDQGVRADDPVRHNLRTLYRMGEAPCDTQMDSQYNCSLLRKNRSPIIGLMTVTPQWRLISITKAGSFL